LDYWQKRMKEAQEKQANKSIKETQKQLRAYYIRAMKSVLDGFTATYDKLLSTIGEGEIPTPADLYKLDKYWKLQGRLKRELQRLGDNQIAELSKKFEEEFWCIYEAMALTSQEAFSSMSKEGARQLINQIWCADGKSWSQRVWNNTDRLQQALNDKLTECVITGKTTSQLKKFLQDEFGVSYNRADTIVRTEMAHIQTQAARQRYQEYGIQEVEIYADTDNRTCPICAKLDGKRFGINDSLPIPAHPRCRCCALPVIDNKIKKPIIENAEQEFRIGRSIGAKARNYKIVDYSTGEVFTFVEGTIIQNVKVFAGKGVSTPLAEEVKNGLSEQHGGEPEDWQHAKGIGIIDFYGENRKAEVHWFQADGIGRIKFKIKRWLE